MARLVLFILIIQIFLISSSKHVQSSEDGFIAVELSQKGLNFAKDLLINTAISSLLPLQLPQIENSMKIPLIGNVYVVLSNITIYQVDVSSSIVQPGETGISIVASGATANLSMDWRYSYSTWLLPVAISDQGTASVQVEGMEIGLTFGLKSKQGTLQLSLQECGCYVKYISIKLDGGASWLYQGLLDAFEENIASTVEETISSKITDAVMKTDSFLQSLPREIPVDDVAALNITVMNQPVLSNSSLAISIDGLFTGKDKKVAPGHYSNNLQTSVSCKSSEKMVVISLHENVLNSAALVYFNANLMKWIVNKVPEQLLLNTAGWRYIIPKLYKQFPNDDMNLNFTVTSPPTIKAEEQSIVATIYSDVTIDVLDAGEVIPVACISLEISASGFAEITRNALAGGVKLSKLSMSLKWSKIGNLHMLPIQSVMSGVLRTVILPVVNLRLKIGFPLPLLNGYELQNAEIDCIDSRITLCSDVAFTRSMHSPSALGFDV